MATYWLDPHLEAPCAGIHGTTSTTTRNGTYASPFGLKDIFQSNSYNTINGITLANGDELRIKGLASISSYLENIGVTDNKIPITGVSYGTGSSNGLEYDSSYHSSMSSYKSAMSTDGELYPPLVVWDASLQGSTNWVFGTLYNSSWRDAVNSYNFTFSSHGYQPLSGWFSAKRGITSSNNVYVSLIDRDYVFNWRDNSMGTSHQYALNFTVNITITDGWTSETVRNGISCILINMAEDRTSSFNINWFNSNNNSQGISFDTADTFILVYSSDGNTVAAKQNIYWQNLTSGDFKLGGIYAPTSGSWQFVYIQSSEDDVSGTPCVDVGFFCFGYYVYTTGSGNSTNKPTMKIDNWLGGMAPFMVSDRSTWEVGHAMFHQAFSGGAMFYFNNSANTTMKFQNNSHLHGRNGLNTLVGGGFSGDTIFGTGLTNHEDTPTNYPHSDSSSGPNIGTLWASDDVFVDDSQSIKIAPSNFYQRQGIRAWGANTTLGTYNIGVVSACLGVLDTNNSDYKNINTQFLIYNQLYQTTSFFGGGVYHFESNDYDNKPLALFTPQFQSGNSTYPALLAWNDSNGDIVVQFTNQSSAENKWYGHPFVFPVPNYSSASNINFSMSITRTSSNISTAPQVRLFFIKDNGGSDSVGANPSLSGNTWNYTFTQSTSALKTDSRHLGMKVSVWQDGFRTYADKLTIGQPTITVS